MDNNRRIILLPIMEKVFEKSMLQRFEPWARKMKIISDLQEALKERCSSLQLTWFLREVMCDTVYAAMLDMRKAID